MPASRARRRLIALATTAAGLLIALIGVRSLDDLTFELSTELAATALVAAFWLLIRLAAPPRATCPHCGNHKTILRAASTTGHLQHIIGLGAVALGGCLGPIILIGGYTDLDQGNHDNIPLLLTLGSLTALGFTVGLHWVRRHRRRPPISCKECGYHWPTTTR
ncbi:hypothetical protein KZ829_19070 [Actinoplanes hulinensis]|uniref:Uncharacterized protein n=1 Tax=Actinoplanes hulinensis TaxID=1144547 RepID=A0ABS7B5A3_9ACTN|nr:hypothetical protein [Actinoplanes hulinensis]MBW6435846.1 hypothetical protein [Actinoplanes hulinensis]